MCGHGARLLMKQPLCARRRAQKKRTEPLPGQERDADRRLQEEEVAEGSTHHTQGYVEDQNWAAGLRGPVWCAFLFPWLKLRTGLKLCPHNDHTAFQQACAGLPDVTTATWGSL